MNAIVAALPSSTGPLLPSDPVGGRLPTVTVNVRLSLAPSLSVTVTVTVSLAGPSA